MITGAIFGSSFAFVLLIISQKLDKWYLYKLCSVSVISRLKYILQTKG